jgi:hypothetical protein
MWSFLTDHDDLVVKDDNKPDKLDLPLEDKVDD